jgi:hypothetical protein
MAAALQRFPAAEASGYAADNSLRKDAGSRREKKIAGGAVADRQRLNARSKFRSGKKVSDMEEFIHDYR